MLDSTTHVIHFSDGSSIPDSEELENLGPGCYVEVKDGSNQYWAEIQKVDDEFITGLIHYELENSVDGATKKEKRTGCFSKNQIINLGCDNYCFC